MLTQNSKYWSRLMQDKGKVVGVEQINRGEFGVHV